ncbi:MAG TPA: substrate-binding domain-containing protein, partial [Polyangiaceae bacterium]
MLARIRYAAWTTLPARHRRKRIAFLLNDLSNSYQASFRGSIEKAAHRNDVNLVAMIGRELDHEDEQERVQNVLYGEWLRPEAIDGVIVLSAAISNFCGKEGLQRLCKSLAPIPVCSIGLEIPGTPSFVVDNRGGMRVAVEHLLRVHDRKRIAYIGGPPDNDEAVSRELGYRDALGAAGIDFDPSLLVHGAFSALSGELAMQEILSRAALPDAVVGANDYMAMGAMDVLRRHGISIAEQVLVVGFDDSPVARFAPRSLSSVAQPSDTLADLAVTSLLRAMNGEPVPALTASEVHLVLRESCGCGYVVQSGSILPLAPDASGGARQFLRRERDTLHTLLQPSGGSSLQLWPRWADLLLNSLAEELDGQAGTFLRVVDHLTEDAAAEGIPMDEIGLAISLMRSSFQKAGHRVDARVD